MKKRLLISFAHPDDESFGVGGIIARYAAEGAEVSLICATNGDAGTMAPDVIKENGSITDVRLSELECAAETLGLRQVYKLEYADSGMVNTEANENPNCLWYQWQHNRDEVLRRVVEIIREVKPHVIITFNEYGGYGHPDHIAIHQATMAAFVLAGDPEYEVADLPPYHPQKLYYSSIPKRMVQIGILTMRLRGKNPRRAGVNQDIDLQAIVEHASPSHTRVDVSEYLDVWDAANACHASQGGGSPIVPRRLRKILGSTQDLTRVYPPPTRDRIDERDIFAGIYPDNE